MSTSTDELDELDELDFHSYSGEKDIQTEAIVEKLNKAKNKNRQEANNNDIEESIQYINIDALIPNPYQYRLSKDDEIIDLMMSIKSEGLIQPIVVASYSEVKDKEYVIVVGHRRVEASRKLGLKKIKCILKDNMTSVKLRTLVFAENEQRKNPSRIESALAIKSAIDSRDFKTISDYANAVGKDSSYIGKLIKLLSLPEKVIADLTNNQSTSDIVALDLIRKIKDNEITEKIYFWFISKEGSRKGLKDKIKEETKEENPIEKEELLSYIINPEYTDFKIQKSITETEAKKIENFIATLLK